MPNLTFVALPVPEILGVTLKILGGALPRPCQIFGKKLFRSVSLLPEKTGAKFLFYSFIRSTDMTPNRMHVLAFKMPEMHPKIVFLGG